MKRERINPRVELLIVAALAALFLSFCGGNFPPIPGPTPTPTPPPPTTTTTTLPPPPGPVCNPEQGQHCGCYHKPPNSDWMFACCTPWIPGGIQNVGHPIQCPKEPTPEPTPTPTPVPTPPKVEWKETTDTDNCKVRVSRYTEDVRNAQLRVPLVPGEGETSYYTRLCNSALRTSIAGQPTYDCAMYGEELAVAQDSASGENFDLILANGNSRPAAYQTTCLPATRSFTIQAGPPSTTYPLLPVIEVRAKVHLTAAQRPGAGVCPGEALLDGVALSRDASCAPRLNCPTCGPEGTPGREACDRALGPVWQGAGQDHPSNPWLHCVKPGMRARVCVGEVCSAFVEGR